jgi:FKBP-type peptidyl-prolyl cis-trans isomerase (trigger factor)
MVHDQILDGQNIYLYLDLQDQIIQQLDKLITFEFTDSVVENEIDRQIVSYRTQAVKEHGSEIKETLEDYLKNKFLRNQLRKKAIMVLKGTYIFNQIGKENNISVTKEELENAILKESFYYANNLKDRESLTTKEKIREIRNFIFEEKITNFILERAQVTEIDQSEKHLHLDDNSKNNGQHTDAHEHHHDYGHEEDEASEFSKD